MKKKRESGMISVEAIIILIIFIFFFYILMNIVNVIRTQIIVQGAIDQAAKEVSAYGYIISKTSYFDDMDKAAEDAQPLDEVKTAYSSLVSTISEGGSVETSDFENMFDLVSELKVKNFTGAAAGAVGEAASGYLTAKFAENCVKKYLEDANGNTDYLENYGIDGGLDGLDFSKSHFPTGSDDVLRITVTYNVKIIDVPFFESVPISS